MKSLQVATAEEEINPRPTDVLAACDKPISPASQRTHANKDAQAEDEDGDLEPEKKGNRRGKGRGRGRGKGRGRGRGNSNGKSSKGARSSPKRPRSPTPLQLLPQGSYLTSRLCS